MKTMERRFVNADTYVDGTEARCNPWQEELPDFDKIGAQGWMVVNAPRPLPGDIEWQGKFIQGIFYAAGSPADYSQRWQDLGACEIVLINNDKVKTMILNRASEEGNADQIQLLLSSGDVTWSDLAEMYNFPWRE